MPIACASGRASHLLMAAGVVLPSLWLAPATIAVAALAVGGTFMVATMLGLQEARSRAPHNPTQLLAAMTAAFAIGQLAGPLVSGSIDLLQLGPHAALGYALQLAAVALAASACTSASVAIACAARGFNEQKILAPGYDSADALDQKGASKMSSPYAQITVRARTGDGALDALIDFYRAFNSRDLDALAANWADGDAPSMSNPIGGIRRGWPAIAGGLLQAVRRTGQRRRHLPRFHQPGRQRLASVRRAREGNLPHA